MKVPSIFPLVSGLMTASEISLHSAIVCARSRDHTEIRTQARPLYLKTMTKLIEFGRVPAFRFVGLEHFMTSIHDRGQALEENIGGSKVKNRY